MLIVEAADPSAPGPRALLEASHQLMTELFDDEDNHFLSIDALRAPDIHFFAARDLASNDILGTGALKAKATYGEVKSMFTAPHARCRGVAAALLRQIEDRACEIGLPALRLETGHSLHAAHALYKRHGFTEHGPFGDYTDSPASLFFEKPL